MNIEELSNRISKYTFNDISELVLEAIKVFRSEWNGGVVENISGEAIIIGDIHGDLDTMIEIFRKTDLISFLESGGKLISLGDIIDRGPNQVEAINIILWLKINYPENVVFIRGNHEPPPQLPPYPHDFPYILRYKFGEKGSELYNLYFTLFQSLPHAGITRNRLFLVHGGIPPERHDIKYLRDPDPKTLEYLLWSDPFEGFGSMPSMRGAGHEFGKDITISFLEENNLIAIIRGHEPCEGYKFNHDNRVLTLFSRVGEPYFNYTAAYLRIPLDENLDITMIKDFITTITRYY